MLREQTDVLIIGAGPAGCVAAAYLHQQGFKVKVVEKTVFPRFVIGESLLPKCMHHFEEVGLLDCLQKRGYEKKYGARFIRQGEHCLFDFSKKHTAGWNWTWQVPRADFDNTLAQEIIRKGVAVDFQTAVIDVAFDGSNSLTRLETENGPKEIAAKFIIDASGYGRVLARLQGLEKASSLDDNSSIFTHVKESKRPKGEEGTLISFDVVKKKMWLWVIPFSNGQTSIGFVGPTALMDSYGEDAHKALRDMLQLSDYYKDRFENEEFLFTPRRIKHMAKAVKQIYGEGYALTGNSAEFLDPVFSSGVTFATESALKAAKLASQQLKGNTVDWEQCYAKYMQQGADVFATYVKEWYTGNLQELFFHRPENPEVKRRICAVLAGYVWDQSNPFVKKHHRIIENMAYMLSMQKNTLKT